MYLFLALARLVLISAIVASFDVKAMAENSSAGSVAILGGSTSLSNGGGSPATYGAAADYFLQPSMSLGAQVNAMSPNASLNGVSYTNSLTNVDLTLKYFANSFSIGVLLGVGLTTSNVPGVSSTTDFNYGILAGYDWGLASWFSLGPQFSVTATSLSSGFTQYDALLTAKFWF